MRDPEGKAKGRGGGVRGRRVLRYVCIDGCVSGGMTNCYNFDSVKF